MKLLLIRHGRTKENEEGILIGQNDGTLSDEGVRQARHLQKKLVNVKFDKVYSSDLKRCTETTRLIIPNTKKPINLDARLREINFGSYQGKPYSVIKEDHVSNMKLAFPDGESSIELVRRVIDSINEIFSENADLTVVVITHSGPISVVRAAIYDQKFSDTIKNKIDHCDPIEINVNSPLRYPL
jgi:alpha-ribazole phosphatase